MGDKVLIDYPAVPGGVNVYVFKEGRYSERIYLEFVRTDKWGVRKVN